MILIIGWFILGFMGILLVYSAYMHSIDSWKSSFKLYKLFCYSPIQILMALLFSFGGIGIFIAGVVLLIYELKEDKRLSWLHRPICGNKDD